jgi:hypothetical protein
VVFSWGRRRGRTEKLADPGAEGGIETSPGKNFVCRAVVGWWRKGGVRGVLEG